MLINQEAITGQLQGGGCSIGARVARPLCTCTGGGPNQQRPQLFQGLEGGRAGPAT